MAVTASSVIPACCQSVPLAAQNNSTRSRTERAAAVAAGILSFAIVPLGFRLPAPGHLCLILHGMDQHRPILDAWRLRDAEE
jgi:hypothetical protein